MFLYVNGLVIKMYKGNEKSLEQTASVIALRVSIHRGAALWISVTAVTDICGSDGPGHCKPRREQRQYAVPVQKVKGNEICTQSKTEKMANLPRYTSRREQLLKTGGGLFSVHFPKFPQGKVKLNQN